MLTEQQIFQFATSFRATHETAFVTGVQYGVKWANEQNAAEIAELVDALREILKASRFLPSNFTDVEAKARQILEKYEK